MNRSARIQPISDLNHGHQSTFPSSRPEPIRGGNQADPGRRPLLHRPRLVHRIGDPATTMTGLTVLHAPTGYGKSTLLQQWLQWFGRSATIAGIGIGADAIGSPSNASPLPDRELRQHLESILTGDAPVPDSTLADLAGSPLSSDSPLIILVDSLERYRPEAIRWLVSHLDSGDLLDNPSLRIVLSGRKGAELPLGPAAAQGLVTTISPADLVFNLPELEQLVGDPEFRNISDLDRLQFDTKGWPAGVRLYQGVSSDAPGNGLASLIDSYVSTEMLERLQPATRIVLFNCLALPYLNVDLVTSLCPDDTDATETLAELGQALPVVWQRLPNGQPAYRILPMIKASLQRVARRSQEATLSVDIVQRAATWFITHDQLVEAVQLARSSGEWNTVLDQLVEPCRDLAKRDKHAELLDVLDSVPVDHLASHPDLAFWRLLGLLSTGRDGEAFRDWKPLLEPQQARLDPLAEGRRSLIQAMLQQARDDQSSAREDVTHALRMLPATAHHERFRALSILLDLQPVPADDSIQRVEEDLRFERSMLPLEQWWWWSHCVPTQIDRRALTGNLDAAYDICLHQLRSMPQQAEAERLPLLARLAEIDLERGDPDAALGHLAGIGSGLVRWRDGVAVELVRARVLHDLGQDAAAREIVYTCIRAADKAGDLQSSRKAQAVLAQFWLDRGNTELALAWAEEEFPDRTGSVGSFGAPLPALVHAELLIATQRPDEALSVLNAVAQDRRQREHQAPLVRCYALMAQAHWSLGDQDNTRNAIAEAVQLGARQRFRRSYMIGTVDARSLTSRTPPVEASGSQATTAESILTGRELETLQLVASGLGNMEIADRLYISRFTVKNHLASIFAKLKVRNRRDAIRVAQSLGLI